MALTSACSARSDEARHASRAAADFYAAFAEQDGPAACRLLAPETVHEVQNAAKQACDEAILEEDLPEVLGDVTRTVVYGSEAQVTAAGDTVFVTDFDGVWKVVAAGCTPRLDLPYDCELDGG